MAEQEYSNLDLVKACDKYESKLSTAYTTRSDSTDMHPQLPIR